MSIDNPNTQFIVVTNHEEQYAIWPNYKEISGGWKQVRDAATKDECLEFVQENWTDMRPKSLRDAMNASLA